MEKQMKAERQRRESILRAEGEKKSAILVAEGEKESAILRADAVREQRIREAEGEAQALMTVQKALADSIRLLNDAAPTDKVLAIKSLEALQKVADGKATKLIIPSEIQNLTGPAGCGQGDRDRREITRRGPKHRKPGSRGGAVCARKSARTAPFLYPEPVFTFIQCTKRGGFLL